MDAANTMRIVLLGKTGVGKSSLANTIFGEQLFSVDHTLKSETRQCWAKTKSLNGRSITLIDNPGFDPGRSEEDTKPEMVRCIAECAPGPHAFLIVLKVERFTEQEQAVITRMCVDFSVDALTHATVMFTHGDQLPEGVTVDEYVRQSEGLRDLVRRCGGRCHVVDNKYWKDDQGDEYRTNQFQVAELLNTLDKIVTENKGGFYTNEMLQEMEREIQGEEERIRQSGKVSQKEIRQQSKNNVLKKRVGKAPQTWIRGLVGWAVIAGLFAIVSAVVIKTKVLKVLPEASVLKEELAPVVVVVEEQIAEIGASPSAGVIEEAGAIKQVNVVHNVLKAIMDNLNALYERVYNPWNPFE